MLSRKALPCTHLKSTIRSPTPDGAAIELQLCGYQADEATHADRKCTRQRPSLHEAVPHDSGRETIVGVNKYKWAGEERIDVRVVDTGSWNDQLVSGSGRIGRADTASLSGVLVPIDLGT